MEFDVEAPDNQHGGPGLECEPLTAATGEKKPKNVIYKPTATNGVDGTLPMAASQKI